MDFLPLMSLVLNDFVPKAIKSVKRSHYSSSDEYKLALKDNRDATRYFNMYSMLDDKLNSIEIMWTGKGLFLVSFVMPRQSQFLTKVLREKIINSIDYTDDDKVAVFLSKTRQTIDEMNITMKLVDMNLHSLLLFQDELATAIFSLSVLINFLLVIGLEKGYFSGHDHPQYAEESIRLAVTILVAVQCSLCLYRLFQTSLVQLPLAYEGDKLLSTSPFLFFPSHLLIASRVSSSKATLLHQRPQEVYDSKEMENILSRFFFLPLECPLWFPREWISLYEVLTSPTAFLTLMNCRYQQLIPEIVIFWCVLCAIFWLQSLYHFSQRPWMRKYKLLAWLLNFH